MTELQNSSIANATPRADHHGDIPSDIHESTRRGNHGSDNGSAEQRHSLAAHVTNTTQPRPSDREFRRLVLGSLLSLVISCVVLFPQVLRDSSGKLPDGVGQDIDAELRDSALQIGTGAGLFLVAFISFIVIVSLLKTTKNWGQDNPHYGRLAQTLLWCIGLAFIVPRLIHLLSPVSLWLSGGLWLAGAATLLACVVQRHRTDPRWHIAAPLIAAAVTALLFFGTLPFIDT